MIGCSSSATRKFLRSAAIFARKFPRPEMSAARHFGPTHHVQRAFGESARRQAGQVLRKQRQSHRPFDELTVAERGLARFREVSVDGDWMVCVTQ